MLNVENASYAINNVEKCPLCHAQWRKMSLMPCGKAQIRLCLHNSLISAFYVHWSSRVSVGGDYALIAQIRLLECTGWIGSVCMWHNVTVLTLNTSMLMKKIAGDAILKYYFLILPRKQALIVCMKWRSLFSSKKKKKKTKRKRKSS